MNSESPGAVTWGEHKISQKTTGYNNLEETSLGTFPPYFLSLP